VIVEGRRAGRAPRRSREGDRPAALAENGGVGGPAHCRTQERQGVGSDRQGEQRQAGPHGERGRQALGLRPSHQGRETPLFRGVFRFSPPGRQVYGGGGERRESSPVPAMWEGDFDGGRLVSPLRSNTAAQCSSVRARSGSVVAAVLFSQATRPAPTSGTRDSAARESGPGGAAFHPDAHARSAGDQCSPGHCDCLVRIHRARE